VWRVPSRLPIYHFVTQYLYSLLWEATKPNEMQVWFSPFDIILSEYDVVQPDIADLFGNV
jgi:hypothetical protein